MTTLWGSVLYLLLSGYHFPPFKIKILDKADSMTHDARVWLRSCGMASFYISFDVNISRDLHVPTLVNGGCFVFVALILSLLLIFQHLRYYTNLAEQKWTVGVIFMVPVYAT